jgi:hypothetical protein
MEAGEARQIAEEVQKSGVGKILERIKKQAHKGEYGLTVTDYSSMNEISRNILKGMGYKVEWKDTQRDDGYWQISW